MAKMTEVEYYRLWPGSGGDSGSWDVDFIEIPADTPDDDYDEAIRKAAQQISWQRDEPPVIVGFYSGPNEDEEEDDDDEDG